MPEASSPEGQIVQIPDGGNNLRKILIGVLALLFVVVAAEGAYYFYNQGISSPATSPTASGEPDLSKPLVIDDQPISISTPEATIKPVGPINLDQANSFLNSISGISDAKRQLLSSLSLDATFEGSVTQSQIDQITIGDKEYNYLLGIEKTSGEELKLWLTSTEVINANIFTTKNGVRTPRQLSDIVRGNKIKVSVKADLLTNSDDYDITIEVLP